MNITLDIAAALSALIWPVIVLVILLAYRSRIPTLVEGLASRVKKLEFAGVSLELALAKPFVPEWSGAPTALDLRHKATAIQVQDSTARTFLTQLTDEGTGDYAEINLGTGSEWLTSRPLHHGHRLCPNEGDRVLRICGDIRRCQEALRRMGGASDCPLGARQALSLARASVCRRVRRRHLECSHRLAGGRLGYPYAPADPGAGIDLLKEFLERVQQLFPQPVTPPEPQQWVTIDPPRILTSTRAGLVQRILSNFSAATCTRT